MDIQVFFASSSGSTGIKKNQHTVFSILDSLKIPYVEKDIAANEQNRKWMRENVPEDCRPASGVPLPPQIFSNGQYRGDFEAFFEAKENNNLYTFLGLTPPAGSKEAEALANKEV